MWTDWLVIFGGLAAGLDDRHDERRAARGKPKERTCHDDRDENRRDEHKRFEPLESLAHACSDFRFLGLVHEIAAPGADQPRIVRLKHVAAGDPLECNLF